MDTGLNTTITPQVMVRNEAYWIAPVLNSLCSVFQNVLVADCGSDDGTLQIARQFIRDGVKVLAKGKLTPKENGHVREELRAMTETPWSFVCDGDEYYPSDRLREIAKIELPADKKCGFTLIWNVVQLHDGMVCRLTLGNRLALYPTYDSQWVGDYPSDRPCPYCDDAKWFFYYPPVLHGFHLRFVPRSPLDNETFLRDRHMLRASEIPELLNGPWDNPVLSKLRQQI